MSNLRPFHLAISVHDLAKAREFYGAVLGLSEGRSSDHWIDYDFWGHQFVVHLDKDHPYSSPSSAPSEDNAMDLPTNAVDGHDVPVPHFGIVLSWEDWEQLAARLKDQGIRFVIEPYIRFKGKPGEQATMFLL